MSPAMIQLLTDMVKILGPAIITAFVAYKAAQLQLRAKIHELTSAGELRARQNLFSYYSGRLKHLRAAAKESGEGIGKLYALVGTQESDPTDSDTLTTLCSFASVFSALLIQEVGITQAELEQAGLADSPQSRVLGELAARCEGTKIPQTIDDLLSRFGTIIETYSYLCHCTQMVLEARMRELFQPYLSMRKGDA